MCNTNVIGKNVRLDGDDDDDDNNNGIIMIMHQSFYSLSVYLHPLLHFLLVYNEMNVVCVLHCNKNTFFLSTLKRLFTMSLLSWQSVNFLVINPVFTCQSRTYKKGVNNGQKKDGVFHNMWCRNKVVYTTDYILLYDVINY